MEPLVGLELTEILLPFKVYYSAFWFMIFASVRTLTQSCSLGAFFFSFFFLEPPPPGSSFSFYTRTGHSFSAKYGDIFLLGEEACVR